MACTVFKNQGWSAVRCARRIKGNDRGTVVRDNLTFIYPIVKYFIDGRKRKPHKLRTNADRETGGCFLSALFVLIRIALEEHQFFCVHLQMSRRASVKVERDKCSGIINMTRYAGMARFGMFLVLTIAAIACGFGSAEGQWLPDNAALPEARGSWVIDQNFKTSIGGAYTLGYVHVLVQSDGTVFHRKFFDSMQPATPWCEVKFTQDEMRAVRAAVSTGKPAAWAARYGEWINIYAPFLIMVTTVRSPKGEILEYKTAIYNFNGLPDDIADLANTVHAAGQTAFERCQSSR